MSYADSLLATYPSSYGPSNLLSDDLVQRTNYDNLFPSSVPYMTSGRLLSDDLAFNQITYDPKTYRPSLYPLPGPTSVYPTTTTTKTTTTKPKYPKQPPVAQRKPGPPPLDSFISMNDITEYSDSLATASNTNTASSVARSFNGPNNMLPYYDNRLPSYDNDSSPVQTNRTQPKPKPKGSTNEIKGKSTTHSKPSTITNKKPPADESDDDMTPVPSPRAPGQTTKKSNHVPINAATLADIDRRSPTIVDVQAWVNDTNKGSPIDEKAAEEVWSMKMNQLHQAQAQREKEKTKSSRALPLPPKKVDNKPVTSKSKSLADSKSRDTTHKATSDSYFESLFDGDYFRPQPMTMNDYSMNQTPGKRSKPTAQSFTNSNAASVAKNPKAVPQKKTPRYEPPTSKRPPPNITTTSWKKQWPREYHFDSLYPYYLHNEFTHRDFTHKDTDERFREALQKVRAERAEQQQKEINEKTAKRLHYGDYVRHSTKDALLQNAVKPSPWSDFMDMKKGNLYTLSKEEKKQLYNQSRSYGERVRYRNFAIQYANETSRSQRHSVPLIEDVQDIGSNAATPRQPISKSVSRTSKRPDSASTSKSRTKQTGGARAGGNRPAGNHGNGTLNRSNNSNARPSDDEYENLSDTDTSRQHRSKGKQKNVRIAKYDSSGRTTSRTDEDENDHHSQGNLWTKNLTDSNDDLYTVREEKTLESFESSRHKKR